MLFLLLVVTVQDPASAGPPQTRSFGPTVSVQLGDTRLTLPAARGQLPPSASVPDHSHEGAVTHCLSVGEPGPGYLLVDDSDLGIAYAALQDAPPPNAHQRLACPRSPEPVALWYKGQAWSLASPPPMVIAALGPPTSQRGDTLQWVVEWEWDEVDSSSAPLPNTVRAYGYAGLALVARRGRLAYLAVWRHEET